MRTRSAALMAILALLGPMCLVGLTFLVGPTFLVGCHDDAITTAYGKNALQREKTEPEAKTDVKPATPADDYEPPLTPRFETEPDAKSDTDDAGPDSPRVISTGPATPDPAPVEKWITPRTGPRVAANQLLVRYLEKCTEEQAVANLVKAGATRLGLMPEPRTLQLAVKAETEKALDQWSAKLKKVECVEAVSRNAEVK